MSWGWFWKRWNWARTLSGAWKGGGKAWAHTVGGEISRREDINGEGPQPSGAGEELAWWEWQRMRLNRVGSE